MAEQDLSRAGNTHLTRISQGRYVLTPWQPSVPHPLWVSADPVWCPRRVRLRGLSLGGRGSWGLPRHSGLALASKTTLAPNGLQHVPLTALTLKHRKADTSPVPCEAPLTPELFSWILPVWCCFILKENICIFFSFVNCLFKFVACFFFFLSSLSFLIDWLKYSHLHTISHCCCFFVKNSHSCSSSIIL